jgi:hypothetical protein
MTAEPSASGPASGETEATLLLLSARVPELSLFDGRWLIRAGRRAELRDRLPAAWRCPRSGVSVPGSV